MGVEERGHIWDDDWRKGMRTRKDLGNICRRAKRGKEKNSKQKCERGRAAERSSEAFNTRDGGDKPMIGAGRSIRGGKRAWDDAECREGNFKSTNLACAKLRALPGWICSCV
jgi:hypothetical protein